MDDHLLAVVNFLPGEVVVVLDVQDHARAQASRDVAMDECVIRRRVLSHQLHRGPVLAPRLGIEVEPGEVAKLLRQLGVQFLRELAVVPGDGGPRAAAPAVRQQGEVVTRGNAEPLVSDTEPSELDEVVPASARAELRPSLVLVSGRRLGDRPVVIHDFVIAAVLERGADPEACLAFDRALQSFGFALDRGHRQVVHRELHAARDVDSDRVRDHGVSRREDTADRQAVADVRVRHQRPTHRDREAARVDHLIDGRGVKAGAPLAPGRFGHHTISMPPSRPATAVPTTHTGSPAARNAATSASACEGSTTAKSGPDVCGS